MTDDDRAAGRWQGSVDTKLDQIARHLEDIDDQIKERGKDMKSHNERLLTVESRVSLLWSAIVGGAAALAGIIIKLWADRGF